MSVRQNFCTPPNSLWITELSAAKLLLAGKIIAHPLTFVEQFLNSRRFPYHVTLAVRLGGDQDRDIIRQFCGGSLLSLRCCRRKVKRSLKYKGFFQYGTNCSSLLGEGKDKCCNCSLANVVILFICHHERKNTVS